MGHYFSKVTPIILLFSSWALAIGIISKEQVNGKIAQIAAPFNNSNTLVDVKVAELKADGTRVLDFTLLGALSKKGLENEVVFKLQNISYSYGNGQSPALGGKFAMRLDMVKAFGQELLNEMGEGFEDVARSLVADYSEKYGESLVLQVTLEELNKDREGNVKSARAKLRADIDFSKLPTELNVEDVEFKSLNLELSADRKSLSGDISVQLNPLHKSFDRSREGFKEFLEKLIAEDPQTYAEIKEMIESLDKMASELVDKKSE